MYIYICVYIYVYTFINDVKTQGEPISVPPDHLLAKFLFLLGADIAYPSFFML